MRFSSFNFFNRKEASQYVYSPSKYKELPATPAFESFHIVVSDAPKPATVPAPLTAVPTPVAPKAAAVSTKTVPVTDNSITTVSNSKYLIIVGSFGVKENAENLIAEFSRQNLHLSIVGRNPAGLYMVGYGNFQTHDAAIAERENFSKKFGKDSWIKSN